MALASGLTGCGGEDEVGEGVVRIRWEAASSQTRPAPRTIRRWELPADLSDWTVSGGKVMLPDDPEQPSLEADEGLLIRAGLTEGFTLSSSERVEATGPLQVVFKVTSSGEGRVHAELRRGGELLTRAPSQLVPRDEQNARVVLELPPPRAPGDQLVLVFGGQPRRVRLASIELVDRPLISRVPAADGVGSLVRLGGESRRGVGVGLGWPITGHVVLPENGVLSLACGVPPGAGTPSRLELELVSSATKRTEVLDLDPAQAWAEWRLPLPALAGERLSIRCELIADEAAAAVVAEAAVHGGARTPRRSVLLVTSDTHRADHLGVAAGGVDIQTPTLDGLAARGLLFEDCFSVANLTNPAHIAVMTGLHPRDHGILTNETRLAGEAQTLAERFSAAGWATWAALSARHLGDEVSGLGQGFDRLSRPAGIQRPAGETLDVVERWMDGADDRDVFLWLHLFDAHTPYVVPEGFDLVDYDGPADPFDEALPALGLGDLLPPSLQGVRVLDYPRAQYRALVSSLDHELRRVVELPRFRDGVIGFVGDHGESLGQHGIYFNHGQLYPDSIHVPLLIAWPGARAGQRVMRPVRQSDLGRTLLDLAGLETAPFPGRNLVELAASARAPDPRFALASAGTSAAVSWQGLHLILHLRPPSPRWDRHQVELYDLEGDPGCTRDQVDERPDDVRRLRRLLIDWLHQAEARFAKGPVNEDPELREALRELGYLDGVTTGSLTSELFSEDGCAWCLRTS
jgi:arylsulfatase A-like enzyme